MYRHNNSRNSSRSPSSSCRFYYPNRWRSQSYNDGDTTLRCEHNIYQCYCSQCDIGRHCHCAICQPRNSLGRVQSHFHCTNNNDNNDFITQKHQYHHQQQQQYDQQYDQYHPEKEYEHQHHYQYEHENNDYEQQQYHKNKQYQHILQYEDDKQYQQEYDQQLPADYGQQYKQLKFKLEKDYEPVVQFKPEKDYDPLEPPPTPQHHCYKQQLVQFKPEKDYEQQEQYKLEKEYEKHLEYKKQQYKLEKDYEEQRHQSKQQQCKHEKQRPPLPPLPTTTTTVTPLATSLHHHLENSSYEPSQTGLSRAELFWNNWRPNQPAPTNSSTQLIAPKLKPSTSGIKDKLNLKTIVKPSNLKLINPLKSKQTPSKNDFLEKADCLSKPNFPQKSVVNTTKSTTGLRKLTNKLKPTWPTQKQQLSAESSQSAIQSQTTSTPKSHCHSTDKPPQSKRPSSPKSVGTITLCNGKAAETQTIVLKLSKKHTQTDSHNDQCCCEAHQCPCCHKPTSVKSNQVEVKMEIQPETNTDSEIRRRIEKKEEEFFIDLDAIINENQLSADRTHESTRRTTKKNKSKGDSSDRCVRLPGGGDGGGGVNLTDQYVATPYPVNHDDDDNPLPPLPPHIDCDDDDDNVRTPVHRDDDVRIPVHRDDDASPTIDPSSDGGGGGSSSGNLSPLIGPLNDLSQKFHDILSKDCYRNARKRYFFRRETSDLGKLTAVNRDAQFTKTYLPMSGISAVNKYKNVPVSSNFLM